jgi:hypothetical protein
MRVASLRRLETSKPPPNGRRRLPDPRSQDEPFGQLAHDLESLDDASVRRGMAVGQ